MEKDNLRLIVLDSAKELGNLVNNELKLIRNNNFNYIVDMEIRTFANSENVTRILETIRGKDVFILADVGNYNQKYTMYGFENVKSWTDNFFDIVNTIDACASTPNRIWVIEPLLFGSRQHKREARESLNAALGLRILENAGANGIISYDVHDPTVRSALIKTSFDNLYPTTIMLDDFMNKEDIDFNELLIVNPDAGATKRATVFGKILNAPVGGFTKRRDTESFVNGTCQVTSHEYSGNIPLKNKNILVVDDIIASGTSMIDVAKAAKKEDANKIYLFTTYGLFSNGKESIDSFNKAYENNIIDKVYVTNLSYIPDEVKKLPWLEVVDCSQHIAKVIDTLNKDESIEPLMNGKEEISKKVLEKRKMH